MEVFYTDDHPCADHLVDKWFDDHKNDTKVSISSSIQFHKLWLEHIKESITVTKFHFNDQVAMITPDGDLEGFPDDFFGQTFEIVKEIISLRNIENPVDNTSK